MPNKSTIYTRSALFVDFDNIFLQLSNEDKEIANQFATNPDRWLLWLMDHLPTFHHDDETSRRILVRKCYLNPQSFSNYRPYFIKSAYEVVDCPPLTSRGKTTTDIHMVVDILDIMDHETNFEEFIILSGDSDFTPVLLKLRKNNRRTIVLAFGYVSPAYKAASDFLIDQESFIKYGIGIENGYEQIIEPLTDKGLSNNQAELLMKMAERLYEAADVPYGIEASELPSIYLEFDEFKNSQRWLGFNSLKRLTDEIVSQRDDLLILDEDPWRIVTKRLIPSGLNSVQESIKQWNVKGDVSINEVKKEISKLIISIVKESESAVPMALIAISVKEDFNEYIQGTGWLGYDSFKNLLSSLELGDLKVSNEVPGYVFDPQKHKNPSQLDFKPLFSRDDEFNNKYPDLAPLARKIHQLTETPYLLPDHYALLLKEIARAINEQGYQWTRTSKTVRDRCVERGAPIARSHVNFVLTGIFYTGHRFGKDGPESPELLGDMLVTNIYNLCARAQINLTNNEKSNINTWITGGLENVLSQNGNTG
jgi:hypothetical protein